MYKLTIKNKQMEKLFNVPVELFQLEKLTLEKNKTCKVWYTITDDRGDKTISYDGFKHPNYQCVISLQEKLNELKPYLCKLRHIQSDEVDKVKVKGVTWKGSGKTEAFSILGISLSDSEKNMKCDSAIEHIGVDKYPFEMKVRDIIIELESMAHGYIFENKMAEITMGLTPIVDDDEKTEEVKTEE